MAMAGNTMKKSKQLQILIACNWSFDWPYVQELAEWLIRQGNMVDVLDSRTGARLNVSPSALRAYQPLASMPHASLPGKIWGRLRRYGNTLLSIITMPRYDVVNFHFLTPWACIVSRLLRPRTAGTVLTVWGSDFYRSLGWKRAIFGRVLGSFDIINFGNPKTSIAFSQAFPKTEKRLRVCSFGIGKLDLIDSVAKSETTAQIRSVMGIPPEAVVVYCGYNGIPAQNHVKIIEAASRLSPSIQSRCVFVFPMSYGGTESYRAEVKQKLAEATFTHRIIESFNSDTDVARWRLTANILVTIQKTDQLSATVQEHLYCGAVLVAGDWLPYELLAQWNAPMIRTSIESLPGALEAAIRRVGSHSADAGLKDKILSSSGWLSAIGRWESLYLEAMQGRGEKHFSKEVNAG
jgi:hypothetical protein